MRRGHHGDAGSASATGSARTWRGTRRCATSLGRTGRGQPEPAARLLGPARRQLRRRPEGETLGVDRSQRRGQEHAAEAARPDHGADGGLRAGCGAGSGALLEVGTGFHPELTGPRERLPQRRRSSACRARRSRARFDEIVEFAGVGRFLDTPLKRYSSGMELRLAFAVAAHVDSEILARRRGARRRRRRVPAALPREDVGDRAQRAGRSSSSATTSARSQQLCSRTLWIDARARARGRADGRGHRRVPAVWACGLVARRVRRRGRGPSRPDVGVAPQRDRRTDGTAATR